MQDVKNYLEDLAIKKTWIDSEDFNPMEMSGGNFDDAYSSGLNDGETLLARKLLETYFK